MTEKKIPLRKCIGCNEMKDKKQLIRVVRNPNGDMNIDLSGKMAGRGAYVCQNQKCFEAAFKIKVGVFRCGHQNEIFFVIEFGNDMEAFQMFAEFFAGVAVFCGVQNDL